MARWRICKTCTATGAGDKLTKRNGEACPKCGEEWDHNGPNKNTKAHIRGKGLTPQFHGGGSPSDRAMVNVYNRGQSWDDMEADVYPDSPTGNPKRRK